MDDFKRDIGEAKTVGVRMSNFELLRMVAILLIMVVHTNFLIFGMPTADNIDAGPISSFFRFLVQSVGIVGVNTFVLISGWFAIRPSVRSLCNFLFQCGFIIWGLYLVSLLFGFRTFSLQGLADCFLLSDNGWYIKAYLGLYILSPVLNFFVAHASKALLGGVVVCFFLYQTVFGWISTGAADIMGGYSIISFVGLYLLARYIRLYPLPCFQMSKRSDIVVFVLLALVCALMAYTVIWLDVRGLAALANRLYFYTAPSVVIGAVYLLLFFSKLQIDSRLINWFSVSCFAVFLVHTDDAVFPYIKELVWHFVTNDERLFLPLMILLYVSLFAVSVLIDRVRLVVWQRLDSLFGVTTRLERALSSFLKRL